MAHVEAQVDGEMLVRAKIDAAYERVVGAIFASVTQIAKTDRAEGQAAEDKGQLNYHVIMIGEYHVGCKGEEHGDIQGRDCS